MAESDKWERTRTALRDLLNVLSCSKCKKSLHNPQQFMNCGHFACGLCINNSNNICIDCLLTSENKSYVKDETVQKILKACHIIAREIGSQYNDGDAEVKFEQVSLNITDTNIPVNNSKLDKNSKVPLNKKLSKKFGKRKKNTHAYNNQDSKKPKLDKFSAILNNPNKINKRSPKGETILHQECRKNHLDNVKAFLDAGADPNIPCFAGWTPLQESTDYNLYEVVELLLKANVNINKNGFQGRTALHEAARNNNLPMIRLLLKYGAKKDVFDDNGKAPISYCFTDEAKALLHINVLSEVQNNVKGDTGHLIENGIINNNEEPSTSKRITRNSHIQPDLFNNKDKVVDLNIKSNKGFIKKEENTSQDFAIVYEKINSINLSNDPSKENSTNQVFLESPGKENSNIKVNSNTIPLECLETLKIYNENNFVNNNFIKCNDSQESIIVIKSQNSTPFNHQSINVNLSQNIENNSVNFDSEDIIDVEN